MWFLQVTQSATTFDGFFSTVIFGLAFGCGFFIAKGVLEWVASLLSRGSAAKAP